MDKNCCDEQINHGSQIWLYHAVLPRVLFYDLTASASSKKDVVASLIVAKLCTDWYATMIAGTLVARANPCKSVLIR